VAALEREGEQFARTQPTIFLTGAFALGFLGARFFKSSAENNQNNPSYVGGQDYATPGYASAGYAGSGYTGTGYGLPPTTGAGYSAAATTTPDYTTQDYAVSAGDTPGYYTGTDETEMSTDYPDIGTASDLPTTTQANAASNR
jgi:hypothetical protein